MINKPLTVAEAQASEHAAEWRAAMDEEIGNLNHFGCFEKVPRSEALKHGRLVKSKWVFKVKYNDDNTVQRFRARLVAKGFTQVPGSDFYETYSPVSSYTSLKGFFISVYRNFSERVVSSSLSQISASIRRAPATIKSSFAAGSMISFWQVAVIIMLHGVGSIRLCERSSRSHLGCRASRQAGS